MIFKVHMKKEKNEKISIQTPKGRPMLNWIGKKPLDFLQGYPVQLVETYNPKKEVEIQKIPTYKYLKNNWYNLLFHGDNKEVLATLLEQGFRGRVDLIYIDPPFASNKDYIRKVQLRGLKDLGKLEEDSESIIQQTMYEDIWKRDEYFQFMYERLILLKELLAETGSIYVHLDYRMVHYIKILMDEVFGEDNYRNEVIWHYATGGAGKEEYAKKHETLLFYTKSEEIIFNPELVKEPRTEKAMKRAKIAKGARISATNGMKLPTDVWQIAALNPMEIERVDYATQKPERLMEKVILASSNENDLVLDCFMGSGTTCAVAQKLCRRWIGVDVNKGAIQVASNRLQKIVVGQQTSLLNTQVSKSFGIYKVNNYDLRILKTEAKELAVNQYGITKIKADPLFDGLRDSGELVRIIDFNHPLTLLDLQLIKDELDKRPEEDRDVVVICLGRETKVDGWVEEWNKKQPYKDTRIKKRMRQFIVFDLKDKNFVSYEPSKAEVEITRSDKNRVRIKITAFISPTIIKRLELEPGLLRKKIPDFRSMIDVVLIDTDYDSEVFKIGFSDIPEKKNDFVKGFYEFEISEKPVKVAVKIIDMLGEEVLCTQLV